MCSPKTATLPVDGVGWMGLKSCYLSGSWLLVFSVFFSVDSVICFCCGFFMGLLVVREDKAPVSSDLVHVFAVFFA